MACHRERQRGDPLPGAGRLLRQLAVTLACHRERQRGDLRVCRGAINTKGTKGMKDTMV